MSFETSLLNRRRNVIFALLCLHRRRFHQLRIASTWEGGNWYALIYDETQAPEFLEKFSLLSPLPTTCVFIDPIAPRWICTPEKIADTLISELQLLRPLLTYQPTEYSKWFEQLVLYLICNSDALPSIQAIQATVWVHFKTPDMCEATRTIEKYAISPPSLPPQTPLPIDDDENNGELDLSTNPAWYMSPSFLARREPSDRNIYTKELDGYFDKPVE